MMPSTSTLNPDLITALENALDVSLTEDIPGAAIAIVSPNGNWFGASGIADLANNTPLQPDDRFEIGSITKTFVAVTLLQLVEAGQLSLADPLTQWLPQSITDGIPNADTITIQQILNHTSGIADYTEPLFDLAAANPFIFLDEWQPEQLVELITDSEPVSAPGASWYYSNTNFILAGLVVESVTGNSIASEIRNRILTPLNLTNTFFANEEEVPGGYINGYWDFDQNDTLDDITVTNLSWAGAAGAMISNTTDLATFAAGLFKGALLQPDTLARMLDTIPVSSPNYSAYGLGIGTIESPNRFWWVHRGQTLGFRSNLWYSPAEDITYVELINGRSSENLAGAILPTFRNGIANDGGILYYNEAINGDISGDPNRPLALELTAGDNILRATSAAGDLEYVTVTVPAGFQLDSIELTSYASEDAIAFAAVQRGSVFTEPPTETNVENLLGYSHFGVADLTTDILDNLASGEGAIGFTAPLPSGDYTFWLQQTGEPSTYTFDFNVSAVEEPPEEPPTVNEVTFDFDWTGQIAGFSVEGEFSYDANQTYADGIVREADLLDFDISFFDPAGNLLKTYEDNHLTFPDFNFAFEIESQEILQDGFYLAEDGVNLGEKTPAGSSFSGLNFWSRPQFNAQGQVPPPHLHIDDWANQFGFPVGFSTHEDVAFMTRTTAQLLATGRVGATYVNSFVSPLNSLGDRLRVAPAEIDPAPGAGDTVGGAGDDALAGVGGRFFGLAGNDQLYSNSGSSEQFGGEGDDGLYGSAGSDQLFGGRGRDRLYSNGGRDTFSSGAGNDQLYGGNDSDIAFGGLGNDLIYGNEGRDVLSGDAGNDKIWAGGGDDVIVGVTGNDVLVGGSGKDVFVYGNGNGTDIIEDFQAGIDQIGLVEGELTFAELILIQQDLDTVLGVASSGEALAVLKYTNAATLTASNFVVVPDVSDLAQAVALI